VPVGHTLASERRKQGRSLADVERATKIMGRMLDALEHERWEDLPATVYVKGYVQNYAQFLGMDPGPLLEEFAQDLGKTTHRTAIERIPERTVVPHRREVHELPRRLWLGIAIGVAVLALLLWIISSVARRDEEPPPVPVTTTGTVETTATPGLTDPASVTPGLDPATETVPEGSFALAVQVAEGESSWLRVTVDGEVVYEGTLAGGQPREWVVADEAVVRVGKPGSVTITRDDDVVEVPMGGGIAEVTLTAGE
jgi:cytoskeletal protein RodZ